MTGLSHEKSRVLPGGGLTAGIQARRKHAAPNFLRFRNFGVASKSGRGVRL